MELRGVVLDYTAWQIMGEAQCNMRWQGACERAREGGVVDKRPVTFEEINFERKWLFNPS